MTAQKNALTLIKDLIFSAKVKEALGDIPSMQARSLEEFQSGLQQSPTLAIINLNIPGDLPFEALQSAKASNVPTLCFFSHVDTELKARALSLGATIISPRSKLIANLHELLSKNC